MILSDSQGYYFILSSADYLKFKLYTRVSLEIAYIIDLLNHVIELIILLPDKTKFYPLDRKTSGILLKTK